MAVTFEPGAQTHLVARLAKTAHIVVGHAVGNQTAQIPEEAVADVATAHHLAAQYGQIGGRVVAVFLHKAISHVVGPVQTTGLVAVLYHNLEGLAVVGRDAAQNLANKVVEMVLDVLFAHLVYLQAGPLGRCRGVGLTGGAHRQAGDGPAALGSIPLEHIPVHLVGQVDDPGGVDACSGFGFGLRGPHICIPHGQRSLEHLAQGLLCKAFYHGTGGEFDVQRAASGLCQHQTEGVRAGLGNRHNYRCIRHIAHVHAGIAAVYGDVRKLLPGFAGLCKQFASGDYGGAGRRGYYQ